MESADTFLHNTNNNQKMKKIRVKKNHVSTAGNFFNKVHVLFFNSKVEKIW